MQDFRLDWRGGASLALLWLLTAVAWFATAQLGYALAVPNLAGDSWTPIWLPAGLALAALLLFGWRVWPGLLLGALAGELVLGLEVPGALLAAGVQTLEALIGAFLVNRLAGGRARRLVSVRGLLALIAGAGVASFAVAATSGVLSLSQLGLVRAADIGPLWLSWGLGNLAGVLLLAPLLLAAAAEDFRAWRLTRWLEAALVLLSTCVLAEAAFGRWASWEGAAFLSWLPLISLVWGGLRLGALGAAAPAALLGALVVWSAARGFAPIAGVLPEHGWLVLQGYVLVSATSGLLLAVAVAARRASAEYGPEAVQGAGEREDDAAPAYR